MLLAATFGRLPVKPFIPIHLACVKGVRRGVEVSLYAREVVDLFSHVAALDAFRSSGLEKEQRVPTESVMVTLAGHCRSTETKSWPLTFRADPCSANALFALVMTPRIVNQRCDVAVAVINTTRQRALMMVPSNSAVPVGKRILLIARLPHCS